MGELCQENQTRRTWGLGVSHCLWQGSAGRASHSPTQWEEAQNSQLEFAREVEHVSQGTRHLSHFQGVTDSCSEETLQYLPRI